MPIIKSAKKRVRVANKAAVRNSKTKRSLKAAIKSFAKVLGTANEQDTTKALSVVQSELDRAAKKGVIHKNKAARKKAQAARNAKNAGVTATAKPTKTKSVVAKKSTVKKSAAKKTTAKKK